MKYHFKIHHDDDGLWAYCIEIEGCVTQADSMQELMENMQEAISLCIEEPEDCQYIAALPDPSIKLFDDVVEVQVYPSVALAFYVRKLRLEKGMTQKQVSDKLGLKGMFGYQRLERRCNPTLDLMVRLSQIFPELSIDNVIK